MCLQFLYGFMMAFAQVCYDVLHPAVSFIVARPTHLNPSLLSGCSVASGGRRISLSRMKPAKLSSTPMAAVQLVSVVLIGAAAIDGLPSQRREGSTFVKGPRPLVYPAVVSVLMFIGNTGMML